MGLTEKNQQGTAHHLFSDKYTYTGNDTITTCVTLFQYSKEKFEMREVDAGVRNYRKLMRQDMINWIHVSGFTDSRLIARLIRDFKMPPLDCRDILTPDHVVKIDDYGKRLIIVMGSCYFKNKNQISSDHICIIVKGNLILSFTERDRSIFENAVVSLKKNTMNIRGSSSGMLLAFLINAILSDMVVTAARVENMLERIEDALLSPEQSQKSIGKKIQQCRKATLIIRKNTLPLRTEFNKLLKPQPDIITEPMLMVFSELSDQLEYIIQTTENGREILTSLEDLYVSNNDLKTNAIMKRLTVVSTLFIPITFLVGLWGMNFRAMPELDWQYGYLFALATLAVTGLATWSYMKRKKWF